MTLLQATSRAFRPAVSLTQRRTLASSVLLTKEWDQLTTHQLRKEARDRHLPVSGNKASIIARLKDFEQRSASSLSSSEPASATVASGRSGARNASTVSTPPTLGKPSMPTAPKPSKMAGEPPSSPQHVPEVVRATRDVPPATPASVALAPGADAPGIPPSAQPSYSKDYLSIKIPDLSVAEPELSAPVPYVPDFWHSVPAQSTQPSTPKVPKLLVVAGAATHPGGGPAHPVHEAVDPNAHIAVRSTAEPKAGGPKQGFWTALAEDVGVPTSLGRQSQSKHLHFEGMPEKTEAFGAGEQSTGERERTLDADERRGLWVLGGILAGSWFAAGFFEKGSTAHAKVAETAEHANEAAQAKYTEVKGAVKGKYEEAKGKVGAKAEEVKNAVKAK